MHHFEYVDPHETLGTQPRRGGAVARHAAHASRSRSCGGRSRTCRATWASTRAAWWCRQGALDSVVPLEPASMPGRVVIQWDKDDCADMGIVKVDLLGLGMMAVLQDAIGLDQHRRSPAPTCELAHIPPDDPEVYDLLQKADTVGVFQVESRAQMATLPRLKPEKFYDLVVEVAIIRPGPIVGQMVHPYLNRRAGREPVVPLHPLLEPVLARTLGVPLFQEQLLRMAMVAASFTGGQAEELRRAMGFKRSEKRMQQIEHPAARGDGGATASPARPPSASSRRSPRSRSTGFPSRTPPASRCWPTPARISRCTTRRRSTPRSSTTSRWGSTTRPRSSRTRSAAACGSTRSTCSSPTGRAAWKRTAACAWGCSTSAGCGRKWGRPWPHSIGRRPRRRRCCAPSAGADDDKMIEMVGEAPSAGGQGAHAHVFLQHLLARVDGGARAGGPLRVDRAAGAAHRPAARRAGDAGRHRRAERVHPRPAQRVMAGGARRAAGGGAVPGEASTTGQDDSAAGADEPGRAPAGRLRRHGPDHRPAPDGAAPLDAGAARRAARRPTCRRRATAGACAWPAW